MARLAFLMSHPFMQRKNGSDIGTMALARQLEERGHVCDLIVMVRDGREPYAAPPGVRASVCYLATDTESDPSLLAEKTLAALRRAVRDALSNHYDGVLIPWGSPLLGRYAAGAHPRVMVLVQNGEAVESMTADAYRGLAIATVSPTVTKQVKRKLGGAPLTLLNAIDPAAVVASGCERRDLGMVNICGEKGAIVFLNAAANLPQHHFVATGGWGAEAYTHMSTGLANVELLPPQDDMTAFYRRIRVLLVPSLCREAFGRVAIEAQMNGIPVVCTDRCGAHAFVDGLVVRTPPLPTGGTTEDYYRDAGLHRTIIKGFLDAIVTLDDPANYELLRVRALAAAKRYTTLQRASIDRFEQWLVGRGEPPVR